MRIVVVGAGAVGSAIGARLWLAGHDVSLVARGPHRDALRAHGLHFRQPDRDQHLRMPVVNIDEIMPSDVVFLAVKSQDTPAALHALPPQTTVVCAQNGIENERIAAEHCTTVVGMMVWLLAVHLTPGVVDLHWEGCPGVLDVGGYQGPSDAAVPIAHALLDAGFDSRIATDIMALKRAKLISNLPGALAAANRPFHDQEAKRLIDEGRAVFEARCEAVVPLVDLYQRVEQVSHAPIDAHDRPGGSLWQSLHRGSGSEVDALNGYIVREGSRLSVPTPHNAALVRALYDRATHG